MRKLTILAVAAALAMGRGEAADPVTVVSLSTVLTEIAETVGGDAVRVESLAKPGSDPHAYEPTPGDLREVASAKLILASGKNLEHYLPKLQASAAGVPLIKVGDRLPSIEAGASGHGHTVDPHWWHSVANVELATKVVRDALIAAAPAERAQFEKNAAAYLDKLGTLDSWVKRKVAELPRNGRELVTSHDAFQYFAKQYGFRIHAIEGVSTDQEASAREIDALIRTIKARGVKAIFLEDALNPKVSSEVTRESGARVGGTLYADGLGLGAGATYEGMVKHNVTTIVEALK